MGAGLDLYDLRPVSLYDLAVARSRWRGPGQVAESPRSCRADAGAAERAQGHGGRNRRGMTGDRAGIRPGEASVELPGQFDAGLYFIGRIRTPWTHRDDCPKNARESEAVCTIEVEARWAAALAGIAACSHLLVLYW